MSELLIGRRRKAIKPSWRPVLMASALLAASAAAGVLVFDRLVSYPNSDNSLGDDASSVEYRSDQGGKGVASLHFGSHSLSFRGPLHVLRVAGPPAEWGLGHGRLLAPSSPAPHNPAIRSLLQVSKGDGLATLMPTHAHLRWRTRLIDDGIPGHQLVEINGLSAGSYAAGASWDYESLVRSHAALDLAPPHPDSSGASIGATTRALTFSSPALTDARLLIGRCFSAPGFADDGRAMADAPVVLLHSGEGTIPFASIGWPGNIGAVTGMNEEGLVVAVHYFDNRSQDASPRGQPVALLARQILEHASNLEEALKIASENKILSGASIVLADRNSSSLTIVEKVNTKTKRVADVSVYADMFQAEEFAESAAVSHAQRIRPVKDRTKRVRSLLREWKPADASTMVKILRDRHTVRGSTLPVGHRASVFDIQCVHSAVLDPAARSLWVAEGANPASQYRAFDLRHEISPKAASPTPASDIPQDSDLLAMSSQALSALEELRLARRLARQGEHTRAAEFAARALAISPALPEAQLFAGDLAAKRGDIRGAQLHYGSYLAVGAESKDTGERIENWLANHETSQ